MEDVKSGGSGRERTAGVDFEDTGINGDLNFGTKVCDSGGAGVGGD